MRACALKQMQEQSIDRQIRDGVLSQGIKTSWDSVSGHRGLNKSPKSGHIFYF